MMQSLFSRVKRQANSVKTGDLQSFRSTNNAYLQFIDELKSVLTQPNEVYGSIKVSKRLEGITKVNIKDGDTQVSFIYRNRDLYIIGFVTESTFYIDDDVYIELPKNKKDKNKKEIPSTWKSVIGTETVESLSMPLSYKNILPRGAQNQLVIGQLGKSLKMLAQVGDSTKRPQILAQHLGPFVVAFVEAIRFPIVAREVQSVIQNKAGMVDLSQNVLKTISIGHPDQRCNQFSLNMYEMLLNWGKMSDRVGQVYELVPTTTTKPIKKKDCILSLEKNQLNALLGVANSQKFELRNTTPARGKRDLTRLIDSTIPQHPPLLEQHQPINRIDYDGNAKQSFGIASITHSPDVIGALHLLTVGLLYLYGKKMDVPIGNNGQTLDPREAYGIAADLADRIECFLKFAGFELEMDFEEEMHFRRQLASTVLHGEQVENFLTEMLYQRYSEVWNAESMDTLRKLLSKALASDSGLVEGDTFLGDACFSGSQRIV